ncbi:hypothetical protein BCR35DRAFT_307902 [Leucosporidium creatinivorum]|uniref:C2H2-type domain-containing protein n=1 Tax=Leucosporidium creatinivorum TaxID=106004 RepID=A0A1Y2EGB2_9BASI|nr:hypothetical protein BCR35DRAFT_307902 [Leucosporidium creatinivorum]
MDSLDPPSGLNLDSNYPFDQVTNWSATQSPGMGLPLPLLGSPSFSSSLSDALQPPSWQLDHAPSWQPDNSPSAFASSFLSPLPLSNPSLPLDSSHLLPPQPTNPQQPADDFNSTLLGLLGSPGPGLEQPLRLGEDDEEDADGDGDEHHPVIEVEGDIDGEGEGDGEDSASGSSSEDDSDEEEDEDATPVVTEVPLPGAPTYPLGNLAGVHDPSSAYAQAFALAQSTVNSPYSFAPDSAAYGDAYSLAAQSVATGEGDDGSVSSPRYHGSGDEETPPTSNSSDHDHTRSPYPHQYQAGGSYDLKASTSSITGAPSHYFYPTSMEQSITVSPESTTAYDHDVEEKPFIPALSRPRSAHLRQSYANEEREIDRLLADADPDFDFSESAGSKKRKRSTSAHSASTSAAAQAHAQMSMAWAPPPPAGGFNSSRRSTSTEALDAIASGSNHHLYSSTAAASTSTSTPTPTTSSSKPKKSKKSALASSAYADPSLLTSTGAQRKRTEIPAVEDDPTIRPYGCNYEHCPSRARVAAMGGPSAVVMGPGGEIDEREAISWRTVRELREHCAEHRRAGLDGGQLPFRCALDPCGKTFKSLAGLRFHFQNASANGHFFVSHEEGEEAPSKKFKACVQPTERSEKCPVEGCSKAFKQAAGLAYHLAHTAGHDMTEEIVSGFAATLQSKTRWWYAKMGRTLG